MISGASTDGIEITYCMTKRCISDTPLWVQGLKARELKGEQKSQDWLISRHRMITASDAGAAVSQNKYQTKVDFINKKCLNIIDATTNSDKIGESINIRWGNYYEQCALQKYCDTQHKDVYGFGLIKHKSIDWMGGSPDGITHDKILVEIKCPFKRQVQRGKVEAIPVYYIHQVQMLMHICELDTCHFVQYVPLKGEFEEEVFDVIEIKKDSHWWTTYFTPLSETWDMIIARRHILATGSPLPELQENSKCTRKKKTDDEKEDWKDIKRNRMDVEQDNMGFLVQTC